MQEYQLNDSATHSLHVPVKVAKRLGIKPGAILDPQKIGDLRAALGLDRSDGCQRHESRRA